MIKTRIQASTSVSGGLVGTGLGIYRSEGWKVLWAGLGATLLRAFPTNAATFYMVMVVKNALE